MRSWCLLLALVPWTMSASPTMECDWDWTAGQGEWEPIGEGGPYAEGARVAACSGNQGNVTVRFLNNTGKVIGDPIVLEPGQDFPFCDDFDDVEAQSGGENNRGTIVMDCTEPN